MKFTKMHGLGNDYVFVNCFEEQVVDASSLARAVSDRHEGIGGDGLILIGPSESGHVRMEIYNADGSRAQMCGNGIRCVAKYAVEHDLASGPIVKIETDAGVRNTECHIVDGKVETVRVDMGKPVFDPAALPCTIEAEKIVDHPITISGQRFEMTCVSVGNPHAVIFVEHLHRIDLVGLGPHVEHAPVFPERMNAHFVRVDAPDHVTVRTWERGSGATRACGTGACAVCVAGAITNRTNRSLTAALPGGDLQLEWAAHDHVYMTGPAVEVFAGEWGER